LLPVLDQGSFPAQQRGYRLQASYSLRSPLRGRTPCVTPLRYVPSAVWFLASGTKKGHPIGVVLFGVAVWWSRRKSNPRPSAIHLQIYMLGQAYWCKPIWLGWQVSSRARHRYRRGPFCITATYQLLLGWRCGLFWKWNI